MIKRILACGMLVAILFTSCKDNPKQDAIKSENTKQRSSSELVTHSLTDTDGNTLKMSFDNAKGTVTLNFKGETIALTSEKPASGIWYKNEDYELRGKGNNIELKKGGVVVFEHQDDIVETEIKNDNGDVLTMNFNNTEGTLKVYLNGGEQIDLIAEKAASGIWYKNDHYELRGKGDNYELTKDGKTVFKN